jgi:acyl-CoA synthetase (AMP-forming)/AMP-acid ligase II
MPKVSVHEGAGTLFNITANAESLELRPEDRTLVLLPLSYSYGLIGQLLSHLYVGASAILPESPGAIVGVASLIRSHAVTTLFTVPTVLRLILANLDSCGQNDESFRTLRLLTIGGGAMDRHHLRCSVARFAGARVVATYGLAEAGPRVTTHVLGEGADDFGAVGRAIPGVQVEILSVDGRVCEPDREGEVVVHSPSVMLGYLHDHPGRRYIPRSIVHTADHGLLSQKGDLYVLGRSEERIGTTGGAVYHNQIKDALFAMGDVLHVTISRNIESSVIAQVTPKPGRTLNLVALAARCRERLGLTPSQISVALIGRYSPVCLGK